MITSAPTVAEWNYLLNIVELFIVVALVLIWAIPAHCGASCTRCREQPNRQHK